MSNGNIDATKRNINLDVLRIIMAFFVVCIHSVFPFKTEVTPIIDIAVPVFFMLSGWFFQPRNLEEQGAKLRNVLKSIVIIYFQATVLYLVWRMPIICSLTCLSKLHGEICLPVKILLELIYGIYIAISMLCLFYIYSRV